MHTGQLRSAAVSADGVGPVERNSCREVTVVRHQPAAYRLGGEHLTLADGTSVTVAGTKVKTRHANGRYVWAIVGADETILTYERDITWDSAAGRRAAEMWLHDTWIAAREGAAAQPPAPYTTA